MPKELKNKVDDSLLNNLYTGDILLPGNNINDTSHIGQLNEGDLHNAIKHFYQRTGDRLEVKKGRYFIDIVRDDELIEIQTANFTSIRNKLRSLVKKYKVRLVYPIAKTKYIVQIDPDTGELKSRRRSPKKGVLIELFNELMRIPDLINNENFVFEVIMCEIEEYRCKDGKGSWRRGGTSIINRKLLSIEEVILFENKFDFLRFVPFDKTDIFTTRNLSQRKDISIYLSRKIAYTLYNMGLLVRVGKQGNSHLYSIIEKQ